MLYAYTSLLIYRHPKIPQRRQMMTELRPPATGKQLVKIGRVVPRYARLTDRETDRHARHNTALRSGGGLTTAASIFGNSVDADVSNVRSGEAERN